MSTSRAELIAKIQEEVTFTSDAKLHKQYDESLDEDGPVTVAGLEYEPSYILKSCDEVAYRTGFNDWLDGQDFIEIDGEQYPKDEVEDFLDGLKDDLEAAIADAEEDDADEEGDEKTDMDAEKAELEEIKKFCKEHGI